MTQSTLNLRLPDLVGLTCGDKITHLSQVLKVKLFHALLAADRSGNADTQRQYTEGPSVLPHRHSPTQTAAAVCSGGHIAAAVWVSLPCTPRMPRCQGWDTECCRELSLVVCPPHAPSWHKGPEGRMQSSSQQLATPRDLFQGWAEAARLVILPAASSGLTPPPSPKQQPRAEGTYCWPWR